MAKHNVYVNLPWRELGKVDVIFDIYRDGEKLGQIDISKGDLQYYPNKRKKPIKVNWSEFDKMMRKYEKGE